MKKAILLTTFLFSMFAFHAYAQGGFSVKVELDKKIIIVDSLGLPKNFKAQGLIRILPELLERSGGSILEDYDVQVEGMSVGSNDDVILQELQVVDIEKVEVSQDPMTSYQKNGQGGSINFVLKKKKDCVSGGVSVDVTSEFDLTPQFHINYNTDKLNVRGFVLGEVYDMSTTMTTITPPYSFDTKANRNFKSELARVHFLYTPNQKDEYKLNVSESFSRDKNTTTLPDLYEIVKSTSFKALLSYKHSFTPGSSFLVESQFNHTPEKKEYSFLKDDIDIEDALYDVGCNSVGGKMEYKVNLLPLSSKSYANLVAGFNYNFENRSKTYEEVQSQSVGSSPNTIETKGRTTFFSPYTNIEALIGNVKLKAVVEYQYFRYSVQRRDEEWASVYQRNFTGKFMLSWQFKKNQHLRFILDRKLSRPSNEQIYPYMVPDASVQGYVKGNSDLTPTMSHEVSLDYITNLAWGDHRLTLNAGVSYNIIEDIITKTTIGGYISSSGLGYTQKYTTYVNKGDNKLFNLDLMALYRYKSFSLSATANVFRNDIHVDEDSDGILDKNHSYYYNISLLPTCYFGNGWMGSISLDYHSKVEATNSVLGDALIGTINFAKSFGNISLYCYGRASLTGKTKNTQGDTVVEYNMQKDCVGCGISYHF